MNSPLGVDKHSPKGNTIVLMELKSWLAGERGRTMRLAEHLKVPPSFVSKMAAGDKPVPIEHGAAIELFTCGAFTRRECWPDSYARIWPELAGFQPNQAPAQAGSALAATETVAQGVANG